MTLENEVKCAVKILRQLLGDQSDSSDVDRFLSALQSVLETELSAHVYPDPEKGSGSRCLRKHLGHIDPLLQLAAEATASETVLSYLPDVLSLWIDPGCVAYRTDYDDEIEEVMIDRKNSDAPAKSIKDIASARAAAAAAATAALAAAQSQRMQQQFISPRRRTFKPMMAFSNRSANWTPSYGQGSPISVGGMGFAPLSISGYE